MNLTGGYSLKVKYQQLRKKKQEITKAAMDVSHHVGKSKTGHVKNNCLGRVLTFSTGGCVVLAS